MLFKRSRILRERDLREINFGVLEGLKHEEIMEKYADAYKKWLKDPFKSVVLRAEPMSAFKKRVENALRSIIRSNPGRTVAVICHGGVIGMFVNGMLKKRGFWRCIPSPASITTVECEKGKRRLKKFNDTAHLMVMNDE